MKDRIGLMSKRKIALFDIDKTIYQGLVILDLANSQVKYGIISQESYSTICNDVDLYKKGVVGYEETIHNLLVHWASGLKGNLYNHVLTHAIDFLSHKGKFFPFAGELISMLKETHDVYFVTAEPSFVGKAVSYIFKANGYVSSKFELSNSTFTGNVEISLARREDKMRVVQGLLNKYEKRGSIAFGDSEGDIEMLRQVEIAVCINPTDGLRRVAEKKGWIITTPDEILKIFMENISQHLSS